MLVIRLSRKGTNKRAFFDIVVAEKSRAVKKKFITKLGYYNPLSESGKGELVIDANEAKRYLKNGAQPSQTVARLLNRDGIKEFEKFIIKRASKPKKEAPKAEKKAEEKTD